MAPNEEEGGLHPQGTAAVGEQYFELRKINGDVIDVDGVAVFVAGAGKYRCAGVKHDGDAVGFGSAVDDFEFLHAVEIVVRKKQLVRGMNFDHPDAKPENLFDIGEHVRGVTRVQTAAGEQSPGVSLHIIGNELIHTIGETDDLGRDVIDEHGTVNAAGIQILQKSAGRAAAFGNLLKVWSLFLHQLQRLGLEHFHGLNVDVAVGNHTQLVMARPPGVRKDNRRIRLAAAASSVA